MTDFVIDFVLKADEFSETQKGHMSDAPDRPLIRRVLSGLPWWARPVAIRLARREVRAFAACAGIAGVPQLIAADRTAILRTYSDGLPLHLARPKDPAFYRDAFRLLRDLRHAGVTHNDLDKPQNWLMSPDGRAKIVDFQLASVHRRRRWLFRQMAYEDFRHLLKHKRRFAPALLTPRGRRIVDSRSAPSRLWRGTGKKLYVAVTRGIFGWSDGEGLGGRAERDGQATEAALRAQPGVRTVVLVAFARSGKAAGLHAFCEADPGTDPARLAEAHRAKGGSADVIEIVPALPRAANGAVRHDVLSLMAQGQTGALAQLTAEDPALAALAHRPAGRPVDGPAISTRATLRMPRSDIHAAWMTGSGREGSAGLSDARFPYWSFTKTIIATCALKLVEAGALDLDAPLDQPGYTLRQLLAHTSGLPDYGPLPAYHAAVAAGEVPWSRRRLLDLALAQGMLFEPGQGWSYSNIGYLFVRELIEATASRPLGAVIAGMISGPLGLESVELAETRDQFARLHWPAAAAYDPRWVYHGCLTGTAADAARMLHALLGGDLLRPETLDRMLVARSLGGPLTGRPWTRCGYALGLMSGTMDGLGRSLGHSGGGPFSVNAVYHFPDRPDPVTVACFTDGTDEGAAEFAARDIALCR